MLVNQYVKKFKNLNFLLSVFLSVSYLPGCISPIVTVSANGALPVKSPQATLKESIITNYAQIAYAGYLDSLNTAKKLQNEVQKFSSKPTPEGLETIKTAWLNARIPYDQTEAFRFYDGPIDEEDGPGKRINPWPLDDSFIDYVEGNKDSGIINNIKDFSEINKDVLINLNQKKGDKNNIVGFHALEFLIWGQDLSDGPQAGQRSYTDFLDEQTGTNSNQQRRLKYLTTASNLLVEDIQKITDDWEPGKTNYRSKFLKMEPDQAIQKILTGIANLSANELSIRKMAAPLDAGEREQEHSSFSDSTRTDLIQNNQGISNILNGSYNRADGTSINGPGITELVKIINPELATKLKNKTELSTYLVGKIQQPFDQEIRPDNREGNRRVKTALNSFLAEGFTICDAGYALGLNINIGE